MSQLGELANMAEENGIDVEIRTAGEERSLPAVVQLTIFRVVQEALTNIIRHARASRAVVELDYQAGGITVQVGDDGAGTTGAAKPGFGLVGMRERVEANAAGGPA